LENDSKRIQNSLWKPIKSFQGEIEMKSVIFKIASAITGYNEPLIRLLLHHIKSKILGKDLSKNEVELILKYFLSINQNKGVLIDVGAQRGMFFRPFIWNNWQIFAFEPDPDEKKQEILSEFAEKKNVHISKKACSNVTGEILPFYVSEESSGISSLHSFHSSHRLIGEVETITLKDFMEQNAINDVDFLKIDAEGHDYYILQGFPWERTKPKVIFCEFEDNKTIKLGYDFKTLGNFFLEKGYEVYVSEWYPIEKYGGDHKWRALKPYPCKLEDTKAGGDFICFHQKINNKIFLEYLQRFKIDN